MKKIKFKSVINDFGDEWDKFDNENVNNIQLKKIFNNYFKIFPKKFLNKKKNWN